MALGPLIDIPLMSVPLAAMVKYQSSIVRFITRIKLPRMLLALLVALLLIIFEEHINCGAYSCRKVVLPPTLWFLLIQEFIVLAIVAWSGTKKTLLPIILYSVYG